jgi:hypothetical protein
VGKSTGRNAGANRPTRSVPSAAIPAHKARHGAATPHVRVAAAAVVTNTAGERNDAASSPPLEGKGPELATAVGAE